MPIMATTTPIKLMIASGDIESPIAVSRRTTCFCEYVGMALVEMKNAKDIVKERLIG
ncbi:hypothetical protein B0T12DRAFT_424383 [Alternaria alternata]|nr:hypothetical protein B0T12DRAFT_424383 [Alternaria alternata]